jgi:hypothetical protein
MSQFVETLDPESASAWDKFYLTRFGVDFDRNEHTELNTLIVDPKWYDPGTEKAKDFTNRMPSYIELLIEGYFRIIEASKSISEEDLRNARHDETVQEKLDANPSPLISVLSNLVDLLEMESEESQERERKKFKITASVPPSEPDPATSQSTNERPITPQSNQPHLRSSFQTSDHKRKVSDTSFETKSTETTPRKLDRPEARVQSLQDEFVKTLIRYLWWGQVNISWARGRHMFLTYTEYSPHILY